MSNTSRKQPVKLHSKVLYHFNGRTVRMVSAGPIMSAIVHHDEIMVATTHKILTASSDECEAYLKKLDVKIIKNNVCDVVNKWYSLIVARWLRMIPH